MSRVLEVVRNVETVESKLRRGATLELDVRQSVVDLADAVERLV